MSAPTDDPRIDDNKKAWDETARVHARAVFPELLARAGRPGFSTLDAIERRHFDALGIVGRDVAQVCCNNARELLSLKVAGARRCVGFDISEAFLGQGAALATAAGVDLELVCGDMHAIPARFEDSFDVVYVTVGALGWLPDPARAFAIMARLLRDGGSLFVYEMHPVLDMFEVERGAELVHSYFRTEPYVESGESDYYDPSARIESTSHWFHHTMSGVISGVLGAGLRLVHFEEHAHDISNRFPHLATHPATPPMCYTLIARR
ncbi:MAG: class I SAM-dependent methyltransferase [Deltaproteobacteria bacterium]|nr:class I SAM-dependent methyltransferase [Deltaproteobacteria bacterium]